VSQNGYITDASTLWDKIKRLFTGPDKTDRLIAKNGSTLTMEAGVMTDPKYTKDSWGNIKKTSFNVVGKGNAEKVHEFLAEHTDVEFSNVDGEKNEHQRSIISTNHEKETVDNLGSMNLLKNNGFKIIQNTHNHTPSEDPYPSGYKPGHIGDGDKQNLRKINERFPNNYIIHRVYDPPNKKYYYYNETEVYRTEQR
jgi:hypothetical protein